jgi:hypothetical protein
MGQIRSAGAQQPGELVSLVRDAGDCEQVWQEPLAARPGFEIRPRKAAIKHLHQAPERLAPGIPEVHPHGFLHQTMKAQRPLFRIAFGKRITQKGSRQIGYCQGIAAF